MFNLCLKYFSESVTNKEDRTCKKRMQKPTGFAGARSFWEAQDRQARELAEKRKAAPNNNTQRLRANTTPPSARRPVDHSKENNNTSSTRSKDTPQPVPTTPAIIPAHATPSVAPIPKQQQSIQPSSSPVDNPATTITPTQENPATTTQQHILPPTTTFTTTTTLEEVSKDLDNRNRNPLRVTLNGQGNSSVAEDDDKSKEEGAGGKGSLDEQPPKDDLTHSGQYGRRTVYDTMYEQDDDVELSPYNDHYGIVQVVIDINTSINTTILNVCYLTSNVYLFH